MTDHKAPCLQRGRSLSSTLLKNMLANGNPGAIVGRSARSTPRGDAEWGLFVSEAIATNTAMLIRIDLGKHCVQLHSEDEKGRMVFGKNVSRMRMPTMVGTRSSSSPGNR